MFVGNAAPGTSFTSGSCTEATVAVIKEDGTAVTGSIAAVTARVRVISKKNGVMKYSPFFKYANILQKSATAYSAPTEQTTYLGYNGTSGSLDGTASPTITASKTYGVTVELTNFSQYAKSNLIKDAYYYTSSTSQGDLVSGLQKGLVDSFSREKPAQVKVEKVCSGTDDGNTTGTWSVTNGSKYATVSSATGLTVGMVIRTVATGGAKTNAVYHIAGISGTTIELDVPYQGSTASTQAWCYINTPANYGLKLTGLAVSDLKLDEQWEMVRFKTWIANKTDNLYLAATNTTTAASEGTGNWKMALTYERKHSYAHGQSYRSTLPLETPNTVASSSYTYDTIYLQCEDDIDIDKGRTGTAKKPTFDIYIFTDSAILYNDTNGAKLTTIFQIS